MRKVSTYKMAFTLLSATSLLAGCSGDDFNGNGNVNGNNSNTITFNTNVNNFISKAATYDNQTALQTEGSFTCTAYNATTTTAFIEPTKVIWDSSENKWKFAENQYWKYASALDFFAYMPTTKPGYITSINYSTARQPQFVCTDLPTTAEGQKTLKEFICALATDKTKANSSEGVSMQFKHTFARLVFKLKNPASDGITVNSVTIAPSTPANIFETGGTCAYNGSAWVWTPSGSSTTGSIVGSVDSPLLVIPKDYSGTTFTITVNATWTNLSNVTLNKSATIKAKNKSGETLMNWEAGYSYQFELEFTPEALVLNTSKYTVEQW